MYRDTIQNVADDYLKLGSSRHTFRYNDHDFHLEVRAMPSCRSSNEWARQRASLNMEANIRKAAMGMGHGVYLEPAQMKELQKGQIELRTCVGGNFYTIPIEVSPEGKYSCKALKTQVNSLKDVSAKIMDGIFEHVGIDNMYRNTPGARHSNYDARPQPGVHGMRM